MAKRGRKPIPTAVLKFRGSPRANRPDEPQPPGGPIEPPGFLSEAGRKVWDIMAPMCILMGTLTAVDAKRFAAYCNCQGKLETQDLSIEDSCKLEQRLDRYATSFGLGASERASIKMPAGGKSSPSKERFFRRNA